MYELRKLHEKSVLYHQWCDITGCNQLVEWVAISPCQRYGTRFRRVCDYHGVTWALDRKAEYTMEPSDPCDGLSLTQGMLESRKKREQEARNGSD